MKMQENKKELTPVSADEQEQIARTVIEWLNGSGAVPVRAIAYEMLDEGVSGVAMHLEGGAYKTKEFITGGYQAQLRFSLHYRIQPGDSGDARLKADEALNALADWACDAAHLPALGGGCRATQMETEARARVVAAYENGDEDHRAALRLTYEKF